MTNPPHDERERDRRERDRRQREGDVRRQEQSDERERDLEEAWRRNHPIEPDDDRDRAKKRRRT